MRSRILAFWFETLLPSLPAALAPFDPWLRKASKVLVRIRHQHRPACYPSAALDVMRR